ncbi:transposase [Streptomyces sp. MJP52]|nr:transposase [Streptomyces sp. MJP52]
MIPVAILLTPAPKGQSRRLPGLGFIPVIHDSTTGARLLDQIAAHHPRVTKAWAGSGYKNAAVEHAATRGIDLEVVHRTPGSHPFTVQPRRWVIERTLGWLMHHRHLARDHETHPHRSAAMIHIATIDLMSRRLTHETTPNWRGT